MSPKCYVISKKDLLLPFTQHLQNYLHPNLYSPPFQFTEGESPLSCVRLRPSIRLVICIPSSYLLLGLYLPPYIQFIFTAHFPMHTSLSVLKKNTHTKQTPFHNYLNHLTVAFFAHSFWNPTP